MPRAIAGVLVECDPSIKAILVKIDTEHHHDFIIEEIDDEHLLIKSNKHEDLKQLLRDALKDTVREAEDSSESD
ncbi:hypothetical protein LTR36_009227 [Oleoguttula mirabilis]|uniref:General transcription and DNA repair factor IIH subunit TFB5 n=1 Tax=Oleoguttula mirabilis TaxID=1507867 RepID=A0AAV9J7J8_9PEZI|nr:hypothetical protein LTR36_009227 [Oleoguttula mirabilis]